jgi:hypothetical protein
MRGPGNPGLSLISAQGHPACSCVAYPTFVEPYVPPPPPPPPETPPPNGYWVSPIGVATWANAGPLVGPLAGAQCCSLATANANAVSGDTIYLRGGVYTQSINPVNSGLAGAGNQIHYAGYNSEDVVFTVDEPGGRWAIKLIERSYIRITGIYSNASLAFFFIGYGSCYNEIAYCQFANTGDYLYSTGLITYYNTGFLAGLGSDHNWIHHCVFDKYGSESPVSETGTIRISANYDDPTKNNTFENNVFSHGGHDCLDVAGQYNVIRNNVFHNEEDYFKDDWRTADNTPASGYYGNRNIILSNGGDYVGTAFHNLIEGNRIGWAGTPPGDDGAMGIENAGAHTISRFNYIYGNYGCGYYSKMQPGGAYPSPLDSGSFARFYNNTLYKNGGTGAGVGRYEPDLDFNTAVTIWSYATIDDWPRDIAIKNNIVFSNWSELEYGTANIIPQVTYANNFGPTANPGVDPLFVNPDMTDKDSLTLPNLALQGGSPCLDTGLPLTTAHGAGVASVDLIVHDAQYFQDGSWGSSIAAHEGDWIAVGTVANVAQIHAINYATGAITLEAPITWLDNASVWIKKISDGTDVLLGAAPNQGAWQS